MAPADRPPRRPGSSASAARGARPASARATGRGSSRRRPPAPPTHHPFRPRRIFYMLGFTVLCLMASGLTYLAHLPLPNPHPEPQATYVYSDNGRLLADYQVLDRTDVKLSEVPKVVIDAVTSTEDRHFFTEGALDPTSIVRALVADLFGSGGLQGGSTITQQYVKQAYLTPQRTLSRKIKEAFIAIKLEHTESKDQILQNYLNTIYLGRNAYGIEAAARAYFGENVQQLGLPEASLLAGMIREPNIADPSTHPAIARQNQEDTLTSMVRDGQITQAQANRVERMPFRRYVKPVSADNGAHLANIPGDEYYLDAVHSELVAAYGANEVETGGLRVTTTLNPAMQREAYTATYGKGPNALDPANGDPSTALVTVNDQGDVKALIGGQNYNTSEVDLALGADGGGSGRQPGSTFKMFMLATLIRDGYSVQSEFKAPAKLIVPHGNANGTPWRVGNFEGEASSSRVSIIQATAQSINTVYAQLVERIGAKNMDKTAEEMGIAASQLKGAYPSQVLGSADVSPLEMAAAYSTLANGGVYRSPALITKVTTSTGKVLPLPKQTVRTVLTPTQTAIEDYVLQQVVLDGTGTAAGGLGTPVAGKTGTTQNSDDAWFIGYTPKLTTAVWMGYADAERPMNNFRGHSSIEGGIVPAEIWHDAMGAYFQSYPSYKAPFPPTPSLAGKTLPPPTNVVFPTTTTTTTTTVPPSTTLPPSSTTTVPSTTPTTAVTSPTTAPTTASTTAVTNPPTTAATTSPTTAAGG